MCGRTACTVRCGGGRQPQPVGPARAVRLGRSLPPTLQSTYVKLPAKRHVFAGLPVDCWAECVLIGIAPAYRSGIVVAYHMDPANPFVFETPLEPEDPLVGREQELARLLELARSGTYTLLEAPRRFGKTTLLKRLAHIWRTEEDRLAVWVDFSRVLTADEAARRLERAYAEYHGGRLGNLVSELLETIRIRLGPVEIGRSPHAAPDPRDRLHELLELPAEVARRNGHRVHVSLDEFQDILAIEGLDGLVRSHVQHHRKHVSYVFAGSEPSMLRELFSDRARPLYGQVKPVRLGRLEPDELGEHVARQFLQTDKDAGEGGLHVCSLGDGHPQRTMLLAWHLWDHTQTGERATRTTAEAALASALADAEGEFRAAWRGMAETERRIAVAIAHGVSPLARSAPQLVGLASRSSAQRALARLLDAGDVERRAGQAPALTDPLLAVWLRRDHPLPTRS